jgi:hypothetical protein
VTRGQFEAVRGPKGALLVGDPQAVTDKILYVNDALGGISRLTFQMSVATLPHAQVTRAIELLGAKVRPAVTRALAAPLRR